MSEAKWLSMFIRREDERTNQEIKKNKIKSLTEDISSKLNQINLLMASDQLESEDYEEEKEMNYSSNIIGNIVKLNKSISEWKQLAKDDWNGLIVADLDEHKQVRDVMLDLDECGKILRKIVIKSISYRIPSDLIGHICMFLDPITIYQSVSQVSREWLKVCENLQLFANLNSEMPVYRLSLGKFCNSPLVGRTLTKLDLSCNDLDDEDIKAVTQGKTLKHLTSLVLDNNNLTANGAKYISQSKLLSNLTELDLNMSYIKDEGVAFIANSPNMSNLTSFVVGDAGISSHAVKIICSKLKLKKFRMYLNECTDCLQTICGSSNMSNLTDLDVGCNIIEDKSIKILANSNNISNLTRLDVSCNELTDESLILLSYCSKLAKLTDFNIGENYFTVRGMKALCESKYITKLLKLEASELKFGNTGLILLASSPNLKNLSRLGLKSNELSEDGLVVFSQSKTFSNLTYLNLYGNHCGAGIRQVLYSKFLLNLTYLNISSCLLNDDVILKHFISSKIELPKLKILEMEYNKISRKGVKYIAENKCLSKVSAIYLGSNSLDPKNQRIFSCYSNIHMDRYWDD